MVKHKRKRPKNRRGGKTREESTRDEGRKKKSVASCELRGKD